MNETQRILEQARRIKAIAKELIAELAALDAEECAHENVRVDRFDAGRCTETGYRDAGERIICRDCGFEEVA
jgi:hypothetical protein